MKQILIETIRPISCPNTKINDFTKAFKTYVDAGVGIQIIADYSDAHNTIDFNSRYRQLYLGGSSESPRYMGMFGSRSDVGSIWADNIGGLYNMTEATRIKADEMLAVNNGFDLLASHTETDGVINLKVTGIAPVPTKCNLVVLLIDESNHFKQVLLSKGVSLTNTKKTVKLLLPNVQYPNCKVIVMLQDKNYYEQDGDSWGRYEFEVFCVTQSLKK